MSRNINNTNPCEDGDESCVYIPITEETREALDNLPDDYDSEVALSETLEDMEAVENEDGSYDIKGKT